MEIFHNAFGLFSGLLALLMVMFLIAAVLAPDALMKRMRMLRHILWPNLAGRKIAAHVVAFAILFTSCLTIPANAQNFGSSVYSYPGVRATYSASIVGLAPASSATDLFTIAGAAGKVIRVTRLQCTGTSTAVGNSILQVIKRSTLNTTGTFTNPTAVPHDVSDPAASAVVSAYTVNPSALGTSVGVLRVGYVTTGTAIAAGSAFTQDFGLVSDKQALLRSATALLAINANAASLASGAALNCTVEWTESAT